MDSANLRTIEVKVMKGTGSIIGKKVKESKFYKMEVFTKALLRMVLKLALESTIGQISHNMKDHGNMMNSKVKVNTIGTMEENI